MDDLSRLLAEYFEYAMADIHTALPGVVVNYDPKTRRADVQPSLKRKMPGGKFLKFPVIPDVPVRYSGNKEYTIHFPLNEGDEVVLIVAERALRTWKSKGGKGIEENSPRRFDIQDCIAITGGAPVDFIPVEENGLNIVHKTKPKGEFISRVTMDDERVAIKYKEKAVFTIADDHINGKTEKCEVSISKGNIFAKNGKDAITMMDGDIDVKSPTPIGLNDGLYSTALSLYLNAETAAVTALQTAASAAAAQLSVLDALSGGAGTIAGLGAALVAFCTAVINADTAAHTSIAKAVK